MVLIDSHTHLSMEAFDADREAVIGRALEAGVLRILDIGTDIQTSLAAAQLAERVPQIFAAAGIHPHEAEKSKNGDFETLRELLGRERVVAVGEIGLDYHYDFSPREVQRALFKKQLALALELKLPVVVHVREAMRDALADIDAVSTRPWRGVFHCFGGSESDALAVLDRGFGISFTGVVTFGNFRQNAAVLAVPAGRLLLETDCPFMTPVPCRGRRNEPAHVVRILDHLSEVRGEDRFRLAEQTTQNSLDLFGLESPF